MDLLTVETLDRPGDDDEVRALLPGLGPDRALLGGGTFLFVYCLGPIVGALAAGLAYHKLVIAPEPTDIRCSGKGAACLAVCAGAQINLLRSKRSSAPS